MKQKEEKKKKMWWQRWWQEPLLLATSYYHGLQMFDTVAADAVATAAFLAVSTSIQMNNECMKWMAYYHICHIQIGQWRKPTLKTIGPKEKLATKDLLRLKKIYK